MSGRGHCESVTNRKIEQDEEFYQVSKEIHYLWQRFIAADLEKEYMLSKVEKFKHLGYIICLI